MRIRSVIEAHLRLLDMENELDADLTMQLDGNESESST